MTEGKTLKELNLPRYWDGVLECVEAGSGCFKGGARYTVKNGCFLDENDWEWLTTDASNPTFRVVSDIPEGWQPGPLPEGVEGEVMHRVTGKKRVTEWCNVYTDGAGIGYSCREAADENADEDRIAVHRISWDADDGGNPTIEVEPL